jgi:3-hydroxyacyl-CoA dehydrogenase/3a,7a,12a-trihydroxy-5b-cholest-24-enoyl-CoA hydratase
MALRYDGRVAIVTGAGNGIGKQYAMMLASRGAKVVVNDLGGAMNGEAGGASGGERPADAVVREIRAAGGEATANYDSVEFGDKIVATAVGAYGRVDIVINNAGILRDVSFHKMTARDWDLIYTVHLKGSYTVCRAAWPYMRENRYGRIVNITSSAGLYGNFGQANYSAMKLGLLGLSNTLAKEGAKRGIQVNTVAPFAGSRMTATIMPPEMLQALRPEYIAPVVAYLVHESCPDSGNVFEVGGGWIAQVRQQRAAGAMIPVHAGVTPEMVEAHWSAVGDFEAEGMNFPVNPNDAFGSIMQNLQNSKEAAEKAAASGDGGGGGSGSGSGSNSSSFKCARLFAALSEAVKANGAMLVKKANGVIKFTFTDNDEVWVVDLKNGSGAVVGDGSYKGKVNLTLTMKDEDLFKLSQGELDAQSAFMGGKLKLKGNMGLAMKLTPILASVGGAPKL